MKKILSVTLYLIIISCSLNNQKKECFKDYRESLSFMKEYFESKKDTTYNIKDITKNINLLEDISGLKSEIGGDYIGKFRVTRNDIIKWEKWLDEKCNHQ